MNKHYTKKQLIDELDKVYTIAKGYEDDLTHYADIYRLIERYVEDDYIVIDELADEVNRYKSIKADKVKHPSHYTSGNIETIDYIKDQLTEEEFRGYVKGNVLKYVSRERHKNGDEDLRKAQFYLDFLLGEDQRED